jgi:hypothetical protein
MDARWNSKLGHWMIKPPLSSQEPYIVYATFSEGLKIFAEMPKGFTTHPWFWYNIEMKSINSN